jgi:hypothetical protein
VGARHTHIRESTNARAAKMSLQGAFVNRKFSMNRNTGAPRISTKIARRFSTHEPSANGTFASLSSVWICVAWVTCITVASSIKLLSKATVAQPTRKHVSKFFCRYSIPRKEEEVEERRAQIEGIAAANVARNQLQDPPPIPQRTRRPQVARRSRPHTGFNRCNLVHGARL